MKRKPAKSTASDAACAIPAGTDAIEALRRLALEQFRIARDSTPAAIRGGSDRPLHKLRGGLRRLRMLLKLLGKLPDMDAVGAIEKRLGRVTTSLGAARDHDVLLARMRAFEKRAPGGTGRSWKQFKAHQAALTPKLQKQVKRVLTAPRYHDVMDDTARLLQRDLVRLGRRRTAGPVEAFAARRLRRLARRIFTTEMPDRTRANDEAVHAVRKLYRRTRYTAEFFGPLLGPQTQRWARRLKRATDALGDLRDAELALAQVAAAPGPAPRRFTATLKAERKQALKRTAVAIRKLQAPTACRALLDELD